MHDSVVECRAIYLDMHYRVRRIIDTSWPAEALAIEVAEMQSDMESYGVPAACMSWTGTIVDAF